MPATSSALELGDLALTWSNTSGSADLSMIDSDLASDLGLETAMLLSLLTDRRAQPDDVPPSGDASDRRGWWADEFLPVEGDQYGSRMWLLDRSKLIGETLLKAKGFAAECWQWLIDDHVASSIDITVTRLPNGFAIAAIVQRPARDPLSFRFAHTWDHQT